MIVNLDFTEQVLELDYVDPYGFIQEKFDLFACRNDMFPVKDFTQGVQGAAESAARMAVVIFRVEQCRQAVPGPRGRGAPRSDRGRACS